MRHAATLAGLVTLASMSPPASAQTSLQIPLQFDFINPGAKSLALGGAFAGVADDATATFANPAGLPQLDGPEMSLELRGTGISTAFLERGRLSGTITNQQEDVIQGPVFADSAGSHVGLGYFSLVYPHRRKEASAGATPPPQWVIAGYRHELAHIDQRFLSQGVFQQDPAELTSRRDYPQDSVRNITITGYGVAGAYQFQSGISVGAALDFYTFDTESIFRRFDTIGFLGPPNFSVPETGRSTQIGSDVGVAPTIGVMFDRPLARIGVVYRQGASFQYTTESGNAPQRTQTFRVPHTIAVGASRELASGLLVAGEVTWINYSRLVNDYVTDQAQDLGRQASFTIDNGTEVHVGVQYALRVKAGAQPIRLRAGTWYDPDHSVHFTPLQPPSPFVADRLFDERLGAALSQGKSQVHGTGGVGLTLPKRLELNAGFDLASTTKYFSASLIVHFGKDASRIPPSKETAP